MVRTQIQLTDSQLKALRQLSAATGSSVAELIREAVDNSLRARTAPSRKDRVERALRIAGKFSSGKKDVSVDHDRHLAEAYRP